MSTLPSQITAAKQRKNQRGMASVEVLPILVVFLMLIGYCLGFFGIVHSAILQSIGSRAYAFETFRNRSNLEVFRDRGVRQNLNIGYYGNFGNRVHAIETDTTIGQDDGITVATERPLSFGRETERQPSSMSFHNNQVLEFERNGRIQGQANNVGPAWIMVSYGICLDANCGGD